MPTRTLALVTYAIAIAAVTLVAMVGVVNLDDAAADRMRFAQTHAQRLVLTERLRWASEHRIAAGRGHFDFRTASFSPEARIGERAIRDAAQ